MGRGQRHVSLEQFHENARIEPRLISHKIGSLFEKYVLQKKLSNLYLDYKRHNKVSLPDITISDLFLSRRETESVESAAAPK